MSQDLLASQAKHFARAPVTAKILYGYVYRVEAHYEAQTPHTCEDGRGVLGIAVISVVWELALERATKVLNVAREINVLQPERLRKRLTAMLMNWLISSIRSKMRHDMDINGEGHLI